jgi:outer membrane protein TolC
MVNSALASRLDVRALASLRNAAQILEEGALANARPRLDVSLKGGMGTFYDDLAFYYLPDEVNPIFTLLPQPAPAQPSTGAVRFNSLTGYSRAMFQRPWRPIWAANFVLDLPFRNNTLRGRAAQAEAARRRAEVQERDLVRVIRENVVSQVGSLRRQAEAIERAQAAVDASQQVVDSVLLRFQQLDQTLIDTLLAEESLTQDRLTLVRLWQEYLSELARLRFETATLVSFTGTTVSPDQIQFDPTEYVRR